jgi:hypothetical protein
MRGRWGNRTALDGAPGRSRSELVRDALRRHFAIARLEQARRALLPLAKAQGFLTDKDMFTADSAIGAFGRKSSRKGGCASRGWERYWRIDRITRSQSGIVADV